MSHVITAICALYTWDDDSREPVELSPTLFFGVTLVPGVRVIGYGISSAAVEREKPLIELKKDRHFWTPHKALVLVLEVDDEIVCSDLIGKIFRFFGTDVLEISLILSDSASTSDFEVRVPHVECMRSWGEMREYAEDRYGGR